MVQTRAMMLGGDAAGVVGLADAEAVLSRLSFGALLASTGTYWFKAAFTDAFTGPRDSGKRRTGKSDAVNASERQSDDGVALEVALLMAGNASLAATLMYRWYDSGHFPLSNLYESLMFLGWGMTSVQLWLQTKVSKSAAAAGVATVPGALLTVAFAALLLPPELQRSASLVPALKSNWLTMHVTVIMMSYASLLVGSLLSAGYLLLDQPEGSALAKLRDTLPSFRETPSSSAQTTAQRKRETVAAAAATALATSAASSVSLLNSDGSGNDVGTETALPPASTPDATSSSDLVASALDTVDNLAYRSVGLGFALLTVGIISGAVWANEAWGSYWSWDPKETWALISWLVYAMYLHSRLSLDWERKDVARLGAAGFAVIMVCYIGVNLWGVGLHSYGFFSK